MQYHMFLAFMDEAFKTNQYWGILGIVGALCVVLGAFDVLNDEFNKKSLQKMIGGLLILVIAFGLRHFGI